MAAEMSAQMQNFRSVSEQAARAEVASAQSAAEAKTAAEQAAAVRADLQSKQSQLQVQIAVVKSQYLALTPAPARGDGGPSACAATAGGARHRRREDPAIVAAPPGGIPPGDIAPPEGAIAPGAAGGEGIVAMQAALTRVGSPYSWGGSGPERVRLLGAGDVGLPAGRHFAAALQPGAGPRRPARSTCRRCSRETWSPTTPTPRMSAIYIGDGMMVHASTYGTPVRVAPVDNAPIYNVRRY